MYAHLILVLTAAIWGFAFVAQRRGMENLDPFTFNALRFALGALCVMVFRYFLGRRKDDAIAGARYKTADAALPVQKRYEPILLGILLFCAASLQQVGMLWTGAGSAGFITGLYVVFVPVINLLSGKRLSGIMVLAISLSLAGLWLMNIDARLSATLGNFLVLIGAIFWALHIQLVDRLSKLSSSLDLAVMQFSICAVLSAGSAVLWFMLSDRVLSGAELWSNIVLSAIPIIYAGVLSVGVAFTLQIRAQRKVTPVTASVILCLEGVFAMLGGYLLLSERVSRLTLGGAVLLLLAMLVSIRESRRADFLIDKKGDFKS